MQQSENDKLKKLINLEAKNKAQTRLIEKLTLENKDLKKLLQILEEKEYVYKKENSNLKIQLEKMRKMKDQTKNMLNVQNNHCHNLEVELEEIKTSQKKVSKEVVEEPKENFLSSRTEGNQHKNHESKNVPKKNMRYVRCFSREKFGHILAHCKCRKTNYSQQKKQLNAENLQATPSVSRYKNSFYG